MAKKFIIFLALITLFPLAPVSAAPAKVKIGIVYDVGGRGDKSINDAAAAGIDSAKKKFKLSKMNKKSL